MQGSIGSAGETLRVECALDWVSELLRDAAPGEWRAAAPDGVAAGIHLIVERSSEPFAETDREVLTRGAWIAGRAVIVDDVCATGFTMRFEPVGEQLCVTARFRPSVRVRAGSAVLRTRFRLVTTAVLLHYPLLWWAGVRGRAPIHASGVSTAAGVALLAGPGGVGKSTLLARELLAGNAATCDNLAVSDGADVFGLAEPLRMAGGDGRRAPHGRRERGWPRPRVESLTPRSVVVVRLGGNAPARCVEVSPATAARALVTGTLMAGELRRYWAYAATLAAGTGLGPAQPPIGEIADRLTASVPCHQLTLRRGGDETLGDLLPASLQGAPT